MSDEAIAALYRPVEEAEGLPGNVYTDPGFWELEREHYFSRTWMACAFLNDVPEPGDVYPVSIGGWELLVTRDASRVVHVFHNLCAHRGMRVVDCAGNVGLRMRCPWHSWAYDLEGKLVATPNLGGIGANEASGFDRSALGLREVRSETWLNFVFVNIDGKAPSLEEHLAPVVERVAAYDLSLLAAGPARTEFEFHGNWKLAYEGGVEDYHIPWIHTNLGPHTGTYQIETDGGQTYAGISSRRLLDNPDDRRGAAFRGTGKTGELPVFPHLGDTPPEDGLGWGDGAALHSAERGARGVRQSLRDPYVRAGRSGSHHSSYRADVRGRGRERSSLRGEPRLGAEGLAPGGGGGCAVGGGAPETASAASRARHADALLAVLGILGASLPAARDGALA